MSAVLQRLPSLIGKPMDNNEGSHSTWILSNELAQKDDSFFRPLLKDHAILNIRYSVLCARLVHELASNKKAADLYTEEEARRLAKQLEDALAMAELLSFIYCFYIYTPREVKRLKQEQKVFRGLLREYDYHFSPRIKKAEFHSFSPFWQTVKEEHLKNNWPRLFGVRIRRVLITLKPYLENLKTYGKTIDSLDIVFGPIFNYLSWLFFIPRLATNVYFLLEHLVPGWWMSDEEKRLGMLLRFQLQMQQLWFELFNDAAWMIGGILGCFILTGALAPVGVYVTISLFFYDVILASVRAYIELDRINNLRNEYKVIAQELREGGGSSEELAEIESYQSHLERRFKYEQKRLLLGIVSTSALFLGMCLVIPAFATVPALPIISAALVLTITLATYIAAKIIESQKPPATINEKTFNEGVKRFARSPYVMFKPCASEHADDNVKLNMEQVIPVY